MESELLAEVENFDYYIGNSLSEFMAIIKAYPKATDASNMELLRKYRKGDMEARDMLIKTNLRKIMFEARTYTTRSYELLDVINEGVIGFMEAIDAYDETRGVAKFSTFATAVVRNCINQALSTCDHDIRRPKGFIAKVKEYYGIIKTCMEEGKSLPTDEEYCELLGVTPKRLRLIKSDYQFHTSSLNEKIGEEEDSEMSNFVAYEEPEFENLLDLMEDKKVLLSIKSLLPPFYYYVFYNRFFNSNPETRIDIAKKLCTSSATIGRAERRCAEILRDAIAKHGSIYNLELPSELEQNFDDAIVEPVNPDLIVQYLFFRDTL